MKRTWSKYLKNLVARNLINLLRTIHSPSLNYALMKLSLSKMGFGSGGVIETSGELNVLRIVAELFRKEPVVTIFDVGANIGEYSHSVAGHFGAKAIVHAFEPSVFTFKRMQEKVLDFKNVYPHNFGLSDKVESRVLYSNRDGSALASLHQRFVYYLENSLDREEVIHLSTVDIFCEERGIERIHFLKIDVEGHDLYVLKGAQRMIEADKVDAIQFEFGECNIDSKIFFREYFYLLHSRYHLYRVIPDGLFPIPDYEFCQEIFMVSNYLAVHKKYSLCQK